MAIVFDGPVTPDALTTFVREVPNQMQYTLNQILPDRYLTDNTIDTATRTHTNRTARFRAFDARLHVSKRDTVTTKSVSLPALSSSLSMGEMEKLQLVMARTGGTNMAALIAAVYDDATTLTREVLARMEQARGDLLTDGKFTLAGEGGQYLEADFGVPANHFVTAGTSWATIATAPALTNLVAWVDVYVATNGFKPGSMQTSQRAIRLMQQNKEIIDAVAGAAAARTRVNLPELNDLLSSEGLPTLRLPYDARVDVDGVSTAVIADDKLVFIPPNPSDLGFTAWGVSATSLELVNSNAAEMSFEESPGIVGVVEKDGPPYREYSFVDAVGMPVLNDANLLFVADVI